MMYARADYGVVEPVPVDDVDVVGDVKVVGPPALPADAAIPNPMPANARRLRIIVVSVSIVIAL
jgi:hypothetical protein